jgi:hypothetical protein
MGELPMTDDFMHALVQGFRYAVFTRNGRVQVLVQPTGKQVRKRARRGWNLLKAIAGTPQEAWRQLQDTLRRALPGPDAADKTPRHQRNGFHLARVGGVDEPAPPAPEDWYDGNAD